jgi:hypothetical protein
MGLPETNTLEKPQQIEIIEPSPEAKTAAITALASELDKEWREARLDAAGKYEPDIKVTLDNGWITQHGTDKVDIANVDFSDLPSDWQDENKAAAEVVVNILVNSNGVVNLSDSDTRSKVGDTIHTAWLFRHQSAKSGTLDVPFEQLPKSEQDKDIDQVTVAEELFA